MRVAREKAARGIVDNPLGLYVGEFGHAAGELAYTFVEDGTSVGIGIVLADIIDLAHGMVDALNIDPVDFMELQEMRRGEMGRYGNWVEGE